MPFYSVSVVDGERIKCYQQQYIAERMKMLMPNGSEIFRIDIFTLLVFKISLPHQQESQNHEGYNDISGFAYQTMDLIFSVSYEKGLCNNNTYPNITFVKAMYPTTIPDRTVYFFAFVLKAFIKKNISKEIKKTVNDSVYIKAIYSRELK